MLVNVKLVPPFRETEVDSYFIAIERVVTKLSRPKDMWALLLRCNLIGKAQEVCAALPIEASLDYDTVKAAVLRAYELVPEAYRQKFRACSKQAKQTCVEFARKKRPSLRSGVLQAKLPLSKSCKNWSCWKTLKHACQRVLWFI